MEKINLYRPKGYEGYLAISKEESERLLEAYKSGSDLCYEDDGKSIIIDQNGTMYVNGFEQIFGVFVYMKQERGKTYFDCDNVCKIKSLIKKVVFSEGTKWIGACLENCENLTEAEVPDSVEVLFNAFINCKKLKPYKLPSSLKRIGGEIFGICPKNVVLPDGVYEIGSTFAETSIESITLSSSLETIERGGISYCPELKEVIFKEGIKTLMPESLARNPKLNNIVLPKSLENIYDYAFSGCQALENVEFLGNTCISTRAFKDTPCEKKIKAKAFKFIETCEYDGDTAQIAYYDEIVKACKGKDLNEQAEYFSVLTSSSEVKLSYGDDDTTSLNEREVPLAQINEVDKIVLKDGIIVGIIVKGKTVLAGECICTYFAIDEDGTGRDEVEEYTTLIFKK